MNQERIYSVLLGPHVSEKTVSGANAETQVVFKVVKDANKLEIKKAIEKIFSVKVESVQVVNQKGKVKRNRYGFSRRLGCKKAYVRLAAGHEIDFSVAE